MNLLAMTKTRWWTIFLMATVVLNVTAQNIDLNMTGRQDVEVNEPDYIGWAVHQVSSDTMTLDNGIRVIINASGNATTLRAQWHKNTCLAGKSGQTGLRLMGDGVAAFIADEDNNTPNLTDTPTSISVTLEELEPGLHSLAAYHVYKDPKSGNMPTIGVDVVRADVLQTESTESSTITHVGEFTGVPYVNVKSDASELKMANATYSYIEFEVKQSTKSVTVTYTTEVETDKTYQTTNVMLNGLLIDRSPLIAMDPVPSNKDYHVDADDGRITLQWEPATVAIRHNLVFGTDSATVAESTVYEYQGTATEYLKTGLSSAQRYWWRVDEEDAKGKVFKGSVWSFRPRQLAFPGAEGYGRFAIGGRGGKVYHVTSLSGGTEPGTLLYGLTQMNEPRYIVFDVSGIIELDFSSHFIKPYATIAGQTAPGKGVCIKASNINVGADVICRHIRFKRGLGVYGEHTGNAMGMSGADHSIVDHCTAAWGTDETVSGRGAQHISFQYCVISEALGITGHKNYPDGTNHGYAATIDGRIGSWHHNLLVNCEGRNWSMGGGMDGQNRPVGGLDLFNNVVYNWHNRTTDGNCHAVNFVNNYYKMGTDSRKTILFTQDFEDAIAADGIDQAYISGNIRENKNHSLTQDAENQTYNATGNIPTTYAYRVDKPLFDSHAVIHSAKDAMKIVMSCAGATMPMRDEHHQRNIRETLDGTYTYTGSKSGIRGEIDSEADITEHAADKGWEVYPEEHRAADWDTDQDGMPDWYERLVGSDPHTANQNDDPDADGWTLLEDYLELMAHPYVLLSANGEGAMDVKSHFAGFYGQNGKSVTPVYRLPNTDNGVFGTMMEGSVLRVQVFRPDAQGVYAIDVTADDGETTFSQRFGVIISGDVTAIRKPTVDFDKTDAARREFFTTDGRQVASLQSHGVYVMRVTDRQGNIHTAKVIAR